jgi:hypothetical protein
MLPSLGSEQKPYPLPAAMGGEEPPGDLAAAVKLGLYGILPYGQ